MVCVCGRVAVGAWRKPSCLMGILEPPWGVVPWACRRRAAASVGNDGRETEVLWPVLGFCIAFRTALVSPGSG